MTKATATYQGRHIESRQHEDGLHYAYLKPLAKFEFELMEEVEPSKYARTVVNKAIKAIQEAEREKIRGMNFNHLYFADSPEFYSEGELKAMYAKFDGLEDLTLPDVPFSRPEIERALLRIE